MKVFYARVSSQGQELARQLKDAEEIGAEKIFQEKISGKDLNRPAFKEMMNFLRSGDELYVSEIARLGRSSKDVINTIEELNNRGVIFHSLKEQFTTENAQGRFVLQLFASLAELERQTIKERQAVGIALAKERGAYKGRKSLDLNTEEFRRYVKEWRNDERTAVSIMKHFNISSPTFYRKIKEYDI